MRFREPLLKGKLLRRYKRFLADVEFDDGRTLTVHCPNPGAMTSCGGPGSRVIVSDSENPKRKLRYTLELVRVGKTWVCVHTGRANAVVKEALEAGAIPEVAGHDSLRSEVAYGERSRVDFLLEHAGRKCWLEVKSSTLTDGDTAMFPDAVTARGLRHLEELSAQVARGDRSVLLFLVGRQDCVRFRPAGHVDPAYAEGLGRAIESGVEVLVYSSTVGLRGITLAGPLPWEA
jgi:sugar fermentation stimulation protein A